MFTTKSSSRIIAPETLVLAAICLADLATTMIWVSYHGAAEANPLMAYFLGHGGPLAFIAAKCVLIACPLFIAEWARRTRPRFVHAALRCGIAGYIGLYGLGVAQVNRTDVMAAQENGLAVAASPEEVTARVRAVRSGVEAANALGATAATATAIARR